MGFVAGIGTGLRVIRAWVVAAGIGVVAGGAGPGLVLAQGAAALPLAALPSPRLNFSALEMQLAERVAGHPGLADFYGSNGLRPIFLGEEGAARRHALVAALAGAPSHGLPAARYHRDLLEAIERDGADSLDEEIAFAVALARWSHDLDGGLIDPQSLGDGIRRSVDRPSTGERLRGFAAASDPNRWLAALGPQDPAYRALQGALARAQGLTAPPGTPLDPAGSWRPGMRDPAIAALRARLAAIGFDAPAEGDPALFDAPMAQAVGAFQQAAGLGADGIAGPQTLVRLNREGSPEADGILVSLERMRWMGGHDLSARHVWVNLPSYMASIREGGEEVFSTRVVIGKEVATHATPEFTAPMRYVIVNPRWNVPRSITVREYLPKLQANRNAVAHLDVVDGAGNVIPRSRIDFRRYSAANFPYRLRQKPSDDNALGQVKFMFPNPWNIYLHDTPTRHLFDRPERAYSHGCIRVARPIDLAREVLRGQLDDPDRAIGRALESGRETYLNLRAPIPVHLVYFTTFPDADGRLRHWPDIYGRDPVVLAALRHAAAEAAQERIPGLD